MSMPLSLRVTIMIYVARHHQLVGDSDTAQVCVHILQQLKCRRGWLHFHRSTKSVIGRERETENGDVCIEYAHILCCLIFIMERSNTHIVRRIVTGRTRKEGRKEGIGGGSRMDGPAAPARRQRRAGNGHGARDKRRKARGDPIPIRG
jgi:hypothetical protein